MCDEHKYIILHEWKFIFSFQFLFWSKNNYFLLLCMMFMNGANGLVYLLHTFCSLHSNLFLVIFILRFMSALSLHGRAMVQNTVLFRNATSCLRCEISTFVHKSFPFFLSPYELANALFCFLLIFESSLTTLPMGWIINPT